MKNVPLEDRSRLVSDRLLELAALLSAPYLTGSVWSLFQTTFSSNNNTRWNASNTNVFDPAVNGPLNFACWQTCRGQDANSTFSDAGVSCSAPTPNQVDYWLTTYFDGNVQRVSQGASANYTIQVFPVGLSAARSALVSTA